MMNRLGLGVEEIEGLLERAVAAGALSEGDREAMGCYLPKALTIVGRLCELVLRVMPALRAAVRPVPSEEDFDAAMAALEAEDVADEALPPGEDTEALVRAADAAEFRFGLPWLRARRQQDLASSFRSELGDEGTRRLFQILDEDREGGED